MMPTVRVQCPRCSDLCAPHACPTDLGRMGGDMMEELISELRPEDEGSEQREGWGEARVLSQQRDQHEQRCMIPVSCAYTFAESHVRKNVS